MVEEGGRWRPRWERLARADKSWVMRDGETGSTLTYIRRESCEGFSSHGGVWVLLSKHLQLLATFECDTADPIPPLGMAELAIRHSYLQLEEDAEGPAAVDFAEVYDLVMKP